MKWKRRVVDGVFGVTRGVVVKQINLSCRQFNYTLKSKILALHRIRSGRSRPGDGIEKKYCKRILM